MYHTEKYIDQKLHLFFAITVGLIYVIGAILYTIFENISRFSDPYQILLALVLAGAGIRLILVSTNLLPTLDKNMNFFVLIGSLLSALGIVDFIILYPNDWYYPKVSYVILAYSIGILLLLSNIILHHSTNISASVDLILENENMYRGNTMSSEEDQSSIAINEIIVSKINPENEFLTWNSTDQDNNIYTYDNQTNPNELEIKECTIELLSETIPKTIFPETIADSVLESFPDTESLSTSAEGVNAKSLQITKKTGVKKDDHMREAAHKILRFHFEKMLKHEPGTMLGKDIEELHDMRVAAMRMRAVLDVFNGHLDMHVMQPFFRSIKVTRKSLGTVRDLDVFMDKIQHYIESLPEGKKSEMDELINTLIIERDKARGSMLLHLDSRKYAKFKLKFSKMLENNGEWNESIVNKIGKPIPHKVRDVLPPLLYIQLAAVRAYDDLLHETELSYELLHTLRIDVKILRYTLEFFEEVLGEKTNSLVKDLKALQDNLGEIHDAVVAMQLLENYLKYGKWGIIEGKKTSEKNGMESEPGIEKYLAYRRNEIIELLEAFPKLWKKVIEQDFGIRFSSVISELYHN